MSKKKIAFVYSSKEGMATSFGFKFREGREEDEEPPPDLFAECDSEETIEAISNVLGKIYDVFPVESDAQSFEYLKRIRPDLVFNIAELLFGPNRESHIPSICEFLNIPYTGSDPLTLGICLDKSRTKEILSYHHIPTPEFITAELEKDIPEDFPLPAIVKPCFEGSSKGIYNHSVVKDRETLIQRVRDVVTRYQQSALVERFLMGREFTVGVLGNYPQAEILPVVEIDHTQLPKGALPIYSYEAKWVWDRPEKPLKIFKCPARISHNLRERIETIVLEAYRILRIRDWARVDIRLDESGEPNILEVNPLPGILPNPEDNSCLPKAARAAGYSYSDLVLRVVDEAMARYGLAK